MLNEGLAVPEDEEAKVLKVLEGVELVGKINTEDTLIVDNIKYSARQGHVQVRTQPPNMDQVALVGGGPSLKDPEVQRELRDLIWSGAKLVTVKIGRAHV